MDGFSADNVYSCYDRFVIFVIACNYLPTQGADLCKLCLYLLGYFLGFLLGVYIGGFFDCILEIELQVNQVHVYEIKKSFWVMSYLVGVGL